MQASVNQKGEEMVLQKSAENTLKNLSARSMLLLVCSLGVLTLFTLIKIIIMAASSDMNPFLTSIYYFAGRGAEPVVNAVAGLFIFVFLVFSAFSVLLIYRGGKRNDVKSVKAGLRMLKGILTYALIMSIVFILVSLSSVSVMYQAAAIEHNVHMNDMPSMIDAARYANVGGMSSYSLFVGTVFFGAILIVSILFFSCFISAVNNTLSCQPAGTSSCIASLIVSCVGAFVFFLFFFKDLGELVMPSEIGSTIQFTYVGGAITDVILTAALTTFFAAVIWLAFYYQSGIQDARRAAAPYFTYPFTQPPVTNQNRPPQRPSANYRQVTVNTTAEPVNNNNNDSKDNNEKSSEKETNQTDK